MSTEPSRASSQVGTRIDHAPFAMVGSPRYFFTNKSDDIRKIFSDTLTKVGVEWSTLARGSDPYHISVARRASAGLMDEHVGPKY
jgi:hypothetical protein